MVIILDELLETETVIEVVNGRA